MGRQVERVSPGIPGGGAGSEPGEARRTRRAPGWRRSVRQSGLSGGSALGDRALEGRPGREGGRQARADGGPVPTCRAV